MAIEIAVNAQKDQAQQYSCVSRFMLLDFAKRVNKF